MADVVKPYPSGTHRRASLPCGRRPETRSEKGAKAPGHCRSRTTPPEIPPVVSRLSLHANTEAFPLDPTKSCRSPEACGSGSSTWRSLDGRRHPRRPTRGSCSAYPCSAADTQAEDDPRECMVTVLYAPGGTPGQGPEERSRDVLDEAGLGRGEAPGDAAGERLGILAHAWPLPALPRGGGRSREILIAGKGRSRPEAKHSSWLRERRSLDRLKAQVRPAAEPRHACPLPSPSRFVSGASAMKRSATRARAREALSGHDRRRAGRGNAWWWWCSWSAHGSMFARRDSFRERLRAEAPDFRLWWKASCRRVRRAYVATLRSSTTERDPLPSSL